MKDLTNQTFGRLKVIGYAGKDKHQRALWYCKCKCGNTKVIPGFSLTSGSIRSCGCLRKESIRKNRYVPEYGNNSYIIDLTGQHFGDEYGGFTVLHQADYVPGRDNGRAYWVCQCDCGKVFETSGKQIRSGKVKSCGCRVGVRCAERNRKHGVQDTEVGKKIYKVHVDMMRRCYDKTRPEYPRYGGRGIYVVDEWNRNVNGDDALINFYNWMLKQGYTLGCGLTIDRIDNDGPYAPWNCRLSDRIEQCNNRRTNRFVTDLDGETCTLAQFERKHNLKKNSISNIKNRSIDLFIHNLYTKHKAHYDKESGEYKDDDGYIHLIDKVNDD